MKGYKWRGNYVHKAQVESAKMKKIDNQMRVWTLIGEHEYSKPQLQKASGLCRQTLEKILRELEETGLIYRHIIEPYWKQFEHCKIINGMFDVFWQSLKVSEDSRSAVEAWLWRLVSVRPQHVGEIVYRIA